MEPVDIFAHKDGFFRVLQRTSRSQAAVMTIEPGGDAGPEEEHSGDQIIYIVEGEALVRVKDRQYQAGPGTLLTIPAHTPHYVHNPGAQPVFFLTVYAPPVY
ncbi:MAG TPA: cupin domain-containing protein [Alphaproteobacteria bacterium]|nr:cupin domain-containing protein [Alphaproteobacteria bacterium]